MTRIADFVLEQDKQRQKRQDEEFAPVFDELRRFNELKKKNEVNTKTLNYLNQQGDADWGDKWEPINEKEFQGFGGVEFAKQLIDVRYRKMNKVKEEEDKINFLEQNYGHIPGFGDYVKDGKHLGDDIDLTEAYLKDKSKNYEDQRSINLATSKKALTFEDDKLSILSDYEIDPESSVAKNMNTPKDIVKFENDIKNHQKKVEKFVVKLDRAKYNTLERYFSNKVVKVHEGKVYVEVDEIYPVVPKVKKALFRETDDSKRSRKKAKEKQKYYLKGDGKYAGKVYKNMSNDFADEFDGSIAENYFKFKELNDEMDALNNAYKKITGIGEEEASRKGFDAAYKEYAEKSGMNPDPDHPEHKYDYRKLYEDTGKIEPDSSGHLPSEYKLQGHPRMDMTKEPVKIYDMATVNRVIAAKGMDLLDEQEYADLIKSEAVYAEFMKYAMGDK